MKNVLLVHKITRNQGLAVEKECKRQTMRPAYINAPLFSRAVYDILRETVLTSVAVLQIWSLI